MSLQFEGEEVEGFRGVVRLNRFDLEQPFLVDEEVELVFHVRVGSVSMNPDRKTGALLREHLFHVIDVTVKED